MLPIIFKLLQLFSSARLGAFQLSPSYLHRRSFIDVISAKVCSKVSTPAEEGFTLAEGTTHVSMPPVIHRRSWIDVISAKFCSIKPRPAEGSKAGFTLAEVLITLGIIGVVAAMTIPTLMANIKGLENRAKFKKTISTLSQAARMSQAKYGFDFAGLSDFCDYYDGSDNPETSTTFCALFNGTLKGGTYYPEAYEVYKNGEIDGLRLTGISGAMPDYFIYQLSDGVYIGIMEYFGDFDYSCTLKPGEDVSILGYNCRGFIDINGVAPPNQEVKCASGTNDITNKNCIVKTRDINDIMPVAFHDGIVEPLTAAGKYVLSTSK